jgi:two-component system chemotaxis response regulator CheV
MAVRNNILLESGTNELEVVEFLLQYTDKHGKSIRQPFGVNVAKVREIIRMPELTQTPNLPKTVCGIFNLRDKIIPALDLSQYLYNEKSVGKDLKMVITEFNKVMVGMIVSDVQRIHRISWKDIVSPDSMQEFDPEKASVVGIINIEDRHILMLDIERIVADIDPNSAIDPSGHVGEFKTKPKAITAEDSVVIRKMIGDRLKLSGFEIESFHDGLSCWHRLEEIALLVASGANVKDFVDVIITDIEMPNMDGYSLTKMIKETPQLASIPVIIFSSIINKDLLHKGQSVGANAQLSKPQIGELLETVRHLLEDHLN